MWINGQSSQQDSRMNADFHTWLFYSSPYNKKYTFLQGLETGSTATPQMSPSVQADTNLNIATAWKNSIPDHERYWQHWNVFSSAYGSLKWAVFGWMTLRQLVKNAKLDSAMLGMLSVRWIWAIWLIFVTPIRNSEKWYCQLIIWEVWRHKNHHLALHRISRCPTQLVANVNVACVLISRGWTKVCCAATRDPDGCQVAIQFPYQFVVDQRQPHHAKTCGCRQGPPAAWITLSLLRYTSWDVCWL